ncbi:lysophospholipid acyltransferase [Saccharomycopsis crataegensis]|uniref:Lysophospholipid acyltransferase n=1 Tax=Saccharomycopsis crataegensis TaxID=43959 RepID=A0AAV5QY66_9ASCO|nr:lysophospholipid acyltransferase [Saccharomycopsis crataegensis]
MEWSQINPGHHLDQLALSVGIESGIIKQVVCLFASFPFAFVLKRLPDQNILLKNLYVIGVSAFYLFALLNIFGGFLTLFFASMGSYLITRYIRTPYMPWINFVFCMGHLASSHLKSQFFIDEVYNPDIIDVTGAQMVLVMKLTSFGWSVQDGRNPTDELSTFQKSKIIKKHPNLINFMSYAFFFPSLLTGPSFDYADYDRWIHGQLFSDVPEERKPGRRRKRMIPKNGKVVAWKVIQGLFWAVLFFKGASFVSTDAIFDPKFKSHGFISKAVILYILGVTYRFKYYAAWTISEAGCILCGLGYNGYDKQTGKFKWNAVQNVDPIAFETGQNAHVCLEAWNMNTNKWLKNYVYLRVKHKNRKPGFKSTLFTFVVSAFWHGTRPGYYLSFVCGALFQSCMKIYRKNIRPIFLDNGKKKFAYDVMSWVVTQLSFGFMVQPFMILDFSKSIYCWGSVYFYPLVGVAVTLFLFRGPYSKKVAGFLKQYHVSVPETKQGAKVATTTSASIKNPKLAQILKDKEDYEEFGSLGVPSQELSKEEFDRHMKEVGEMAEDFKEWNTHKRRSSITDGQEVIKDALNEFKKDMVSLMPPKEGENDKKKD